MILSIRAQLVMAEWNRNLEVVLEQMTELASDMYDLKSRIGECPAHTAGQILWLEKSERHYRWLEHRLACMKLQRDWYEDQIARLNGRAVRLAAVHSPVVVAPEENGSGHVKHDRNHKQFERSAVDLKLRTGRTAGLKKGKKVKGRAQPDKAKKPQRGGKRDVQVS